jgi:hypothetical protein
MAADLEQKPAPASKYENFVEQQLDKAKGRIRALDAGGYLLLLAVVTLTYFLVMAGIDAALELPSAVRVVSFGLYALAALYLIVKVAMCFVSHVNPYYAARQLEQTLPQAKNSVINWLDLREEKLAPAIRGAVGLRAAKLLKQTDAEKAVGARFTMMLGIVTLGLVLVLLGFFLAERTRFSELLSRIFAPFGGAGLRSRTDIEVVHPRDAEIAHTRPSVVFKARISGAPAENQPGAPRVQFRYSDQEAYDDKAFVALSEINGEWTATLPMDRVKSGILYRITAGDAVSDEFHIKVLSLPAVKQYEVTYQYRPYRVRPNDVRTDMPPAIKAHRGTEITLLARTNRKLREGLLELDLAGDNKVGPLRGELVGDDSLRFKFVLDRTGKFRVLFRSTEAETNSNAEFYPIDVMLDKIPVVSLLKPGKDIELPANGNLSVQGVAEDDFGIRELALHMKVVDAKAHTLLQPVAARPPDGKSFKFDNGSYPDKVSYLDVIDLNKLKTADGAAFALKKDMVLEYWLEATDNSDYPEAKGQIGRSQVFKVAIKEPENKEKVEADRKKLEKEKQEHDKQEKADRDRLNDAKNSNDQQKIDDAKRQNERDKVEREKQKLDDAAADAKRAQDQAGQSKGDTPKAESKPASGNKEQPKTDPNKIGESKGGPNDQQKPAETKEPGNTKPQANSKPADDKQPADKSATAKGGPSDQPEDPRSNVKPAGDEKDPADAHSKPSAKNDDSISAPKKTDTKQADKVASSKDAGSPPPKQSQDPSDQAMQKIAQDRKDLNSGDPKKEQDARQDLQNMANNAKDPNVRDAAKQELDRDKGMKDVAQTGKDLRNDDPQKSGRAEERMQNLADNSNHPDVRDAAKQELQKNEARKDIAKKGQDMKNGDPKAKGELQKTASDPKADPEMKNAAQNELDKQGEREDFTRAQQDLKNDKTREQGRKTMDKLAQNATDPNVKEQANQEIARDDAQNGKTEKDRKAAQQKLQDQKAKQAQTAADKEKRDQDMKNLADKSADLNSPDPDKRAKAQQEIKDIADKSKSPDVRQTANDMLQRQQAREQIAKKLDDLKSTDPEKRKKAREDLEKMIKDSKDEAQKRADYKKRLEELAKNGNADAKNELDRQKAMEDLSRKVDELENKDPNIQKKAEDFVREMSKNAKNEDVRTEAQKKIDRHEAIKDLANKIKDLGSPDKKTSDKAAQELKDLSQKKQGSELGDRAKDALDLKKEKDELAKALKDALDGADKETRDRAMKKLEQLSKDAKDPTIKQGAKQGFDDSNLRAKNANLDFAGRGGELNLDDIREKLKDPSIRQKMNMTEAQAEAFLKQAEAYNRELAQKRAKEAANRKDDGKGGFSKVGDSGPAAVSGKKDRTTNPLDIRQDQPPPEFIEAYQRLTRPDAAPPKKK